MVALTDSIGGDVIVNATGAEVPPPGAGDCTVTCAVPAAAMSDGPTAACSCVELTNVVVRFDPFQRTIEDAVNPLPLTESVNAGPPATACVGAIVLINGTGLIDPSTVIVALVAARV